MGNDVLRSVHAGFSDALDEDSEDDKKEEELIEKFRQQRKYDYFNLHVIGGKGDSKGQQTPRSICSVQSWTTSLAPISVKDLVADSIHKGTVLLGKVSIDHAFYTGSSAAFVFEDVLGRYAKFAVYSMVHNIAQAEQVFANGTLLAVREPHFKVRMDGTLGIRVDEPSDLSTWSCPATSMDWKTLGDRFFRDSRSVFGALRCYQAGVKAMEESSNLAILLSHCAECCLRLDRSEDAARFAAAAAALDFTNVKAWVRLVKASQQFRGDVCAKAAAVWAIARVRFQSKDQAKSVKDELTKLVDSADADNADVWTSVLWWCQRKSLAAPWCAHAKWLDPDLGSWQDLRLAGGTAFAKGEFEEALGIFISGVRCLTEQIEESSVFFGDMADARLLNSNTSPSDSIDGLFESSVATLLDFKNAKAWLHQSRFLERLGSQGVALNRLQWAIDELGKDGDEGLTRILTKEVGELRSRVAHSACAPSISTVSTEEQLKERQGNEELQGGVRDEESLDETITEMENLIMSIQMAKAMPKTKAKAKAKGKANAKADADSIPASWKGPLAVRECPAVHTEFALLVGWPAGLNARMANKVLYRTYLEAKVHPWLQEGYFREGTFPFGLDMAMKRWQGPFALMEISRTNRSVKPGDIIDTRSTHPRAWDQRVRSSFANNPCSREMMLLGTTHVAIGFNDLITLLDGTVTKAPEPEFAGKPLVFLGLEMSDFSVAKSMVVAEMLGSSCPLEVVLQVWYSSCWTQSVLEPFRQACRTLHTRMLENKGKTRLGSTSFKLYSEGVALYLEHWTVVQPISAERARQQWLQGTLRHTAYFTGLPSLCRQNDRVAAARYLLSGEVPIGTTATEIGSLPMWSVPEGSPPLEKDQIFNTFDLKFFVEASNKQPQLDIVQLFSSMVLEKLATLRKLIRQDQLRIELCVAKVEPLGKTQEGDRLADDIAALHPYGVSWYNVIDYFEKTEFHDLARHISQHGDAMHFAYSMNWVIEVYGTCLADYLPGAPTINPDGDGLGAQPATVKGKKKQKKQKNKEADADERGLRVINDVLDLALGRTGKVMAQMSGVDTLFTIPFFDTPLNLGGVGLAQGTHKKWLDHFYNLAGMSKMRRCKRTANNEGLTVATQASKVITACPLQRNLVTLFTAWTYDPQLPLEYVPSADMLPR